MKRNFNKSNFPIILYEFQVFNILVKKGIMKRCSTLLIIRETEIKTMMRQHLIPVRMAVTKKKRESVGKDVKKRKPHALTGMQIGAATMENSVGVPQKIKNVIQQSLFWKEGNEKRISKGHLHSIFIAHYLQQPRYVIYICHIYSMSIIQL